MAQEDAGLAAWIRSHRYLQPVEVTEGESGMALLMLWEVDHGRPYPRMGGDGQAVVLMGFTKRLQRRVQEDSELSHWLVCRYLQRPLAPDLPISHHSRWSLRVVCPPRDEPQGWYGDFVARWRCFLEAQLLAIAPPVPPASMTPPVAGRRQQDAVAPIEAAPKRRRLQPPSRSAGAAPGAVGPSASSSAPPGPLADRVVRAARRRPRAETPVVPDPAPPLKRRRGTQQSSLRPAGPTPAPPPRKPHGRAAAGPPT